MSSNTTAILGRCNFKQYEHCGAHERIPDVGQRLPPFGCKNWEGDAEQNSPPDGSYPRDSAPDQGVRPTESDPIRVRIFSLIDDFIDEQDAIDTDYYITRRRTLAAFIAKGLRDSHFDALVTALQNLVDECTPQGRDLAGKSKTVTRMPRRVVIDAARAALALARGDVPADKRDNDL